MKSIHLLILPILVLSSFCKKENVKTNEEQILTAGAWVQAQYLEDADGDGVFTDESSPCELDNTWVFDSNENRTMTYNDIGELCAPEVGPLTISGFWELRNSNQVLYVYLSNGVTQDEFNIGVMNDTLMVLDYIDQDNPTAVTRQKLVLKR